MTWYNLCRTERKGSFCKLNKQDEKERHGQLYKIQINFSNNTQRSIHFSNTTWYQSKEQFATVNGFFSHFKHLVIPPLYLTVCLNRWQFSLGRMHELIVLLSFPLTHPLFVVDIQWECVHELLKRKR